MATAVVMPKLGNSVESSIIVNWRKQPGEQVTAGEILCEVETDKATVEVESPVGGILLARFYDPGDDVPVMMNIAAIGASGESVESLRPAGRIGAAPTVETMVPPPAQTASLPETSGFTAISPRARGLANRRGLSVDGLAGTGPGGRIIERDVLAALERAPKLTPLAKSMLSAGEFTAPPVGSGLRGKVTSRDLIPSALETPSASSADDDGVTTIPVKGIRKRIADRMLQSLQTTAQLTLNASADARALLALRRRFKASDPAFNLTAITLNDLILFAVARTLPQFPDLNSLFFDETIYRHRDVDLGFAVDTPRGLIVPVIRRAQLLSLKALADEASRLAAACRHGSVTPADLEGGTFTVSNLGSLGIESFTPVLNPPQVGILGVGSVNLKAVEVDGEIHHLPHLGLSLTINHQIVDGAPGARFLQAVARGIAHIDLLPAL